MTGAAPLVEEAESAPTLEELDAELDVLLEYLGIDYCEHCGTVHPVGPQMTPPHAARAKGFPQPSALVGPGAPGL